MIARRLQWLEYKDAIEEQSMAQRAKGKGNKSKTGLRPFRRPIDPSTGLKMVGRAYKEWLRTSG